MAELIKKFIVWYVCGRCRGSFSYKGVIVRGFTEVFYNTELRDYINATARARARHDTIINELKKG